MLRNFTADRKPRCACLRLPSQLLLRQCLFAQQSLSYRVTHTYTLGGDGSWDYVVPDPPSHRLYIARENRVMVVDEDSGALLGQVNEVTVHMEPRLSPLLAMGLPLRAKTNL
jgi:hypothetical protein